MNIQINSNRSVPVDIGRSMRVQASISQYLQRFDGQITRLEVHLSDENGVRSGSDDHRCVLEARPAGRDPVVVTNQAATAEEAAHGAAQKMQRLLTSLFAKLEERA